jgi:hypothetical protein
VFTAVRSRNGICALKTAWLTLGHQTLPSVSAQIFFVSSLQATHLSHASPDECCHDEQQAPWLMAGDARDRQIDAANRRVQASHTRVESIARLDISDGGTLVNSLGTGSTEYGLLEFCGSAMLFAKRSDGCEGFYTRGIEEEGGALIAVQFHVSLLVIDCTRSTDQDRLSTC